MERGAGAIRKGKVMVDNIQTTAEPQIQETQLGSTPVDLAQLGLDRMAYIRRAVINDQPVWSNS